MKTVDEIFGEMLVCFGERTGMEVDQGCDLAVRLYAAAAQIYAMYLQADWVARQAFPQTAEGDYLDLHAQLRGLERKQASHAAGTLRFFADQAAETPREIPLGTVCMTAGLVRFETTRAAVLPVGQLQVDVTVRIQPAEGSDRETVAAGVEAAVRNWFSGERLGKPVLLAQLYSLVFSCGGVANCKLAAPADDVEIAAHQLPVLGTLTVEELT